MKQAEQIRMWASERNLIAGSSTDKQFLKLVEEMREIAEGDLMNEPEGIIDGIGDTFVVLTILAAQLGRGIEILMEDNPIKPVESGVDSFDTNYIILTIYIGSIATGLARGKTTLTLDSIGLAANMLERMGNMAIGATAGGFLGCVDAAWECIKDRKGRMVDGVFIKEGD